MQCGEHTVRAVAGREEICDRHSDALWIVPAGAGHRHQTGLALGDLVVAWTPAFGSVVSESADCEYHQPRIQGHQCLIRETEPGHDAGSEVLDEHIRLASSRRSCSMSSLFFKSSVMDTLLRFAVRK